MSVSAHTLKFSLIVATVGRKNELIRLLESLTEQASRSFEVIIVDQNQPSFLQPILDAYRSRISIVYIPSNVGLSRARNLGLTQAGGDVIAFPDDDCWYPPDLLLSVASLFDEHPDWGGLTGRICDEGNPKAYRWYHRKGGPIDMWNLWHRSTSATAFLRKELVRSVGNFDDSLGLGAETGLAGAEDADYVIRALSNSFRLHYCSDICVYHNDYPQLFDDVHKEKMFGYALACGYVLRKHHYPFWFVLRSWIRAVGGAILFLTRGDWARVRLYCSTLKGRICGWLGRIPHHSTPAG